MVNCRLALFACTQGSMTGSSSQVVVSPKARCLLVTGLVLLQIHDSQLITSLLHVKRLRAQSRVGCVGQCHCLEPCEISVAEAALHSERASSK